MFDLVIVGGQVFDGSGEPPRVIDVAVSDGVIVEVGEGLAENLDPATEVIDAAGKIVTPGFIDIHTHFDGQATWDDLLDPVTGHGVTTVLMGNCGVGFAPVRPGHEDELIELMQGVEDIPGAVLSEGMVWEWETFPEYMDVLESKQWSVDVGTHLSHGPLRTYVLGPGRDDTVASVAEIGEMAELARQAMEVGAFGFSTSRTTGHKAVNGSPVPGTFADDHELFPLIRATAEGGGIVFEVAPSGLFRRDNPEIVAKEIDWMGRAAEETGLTATFILLQAHDVPDRWRTEMDQAADWRSRGISVVPLIAGRSAAVLYGWDIRHPFVARPTYKSVSHLPLKERIEELRRPEIRRAILEELNETDESAVIDELKFLSVILPSCFVLTSDVDYEVPIDMTLGAQAERSGRPVEEIAYDQLLQEGTLLRYPLYNYASGDHSILHEQMSDPDALVSLGDGGAHCAFICDASMPTYLMTHWVRDRKRGPRLSMASVVRRLTSQPAEMYGLADRGRIAPGLRADLNVIDHENLTLAAPVAVADLPAGGVRLIQPATGYCATIVAGTVTRRDGADTGARPGRLLRHQPQALESRS